MEGTRTGLPLLAASARPRAGVLLAGCVVLVAVLGAVVVGVIAVRFHYFTDTMAGAAVGIGTVCGLALGISHFRRPGRRSSRRDGRQVDGAGHEVAR